MPGGDRADGGGVEVARARLRVNLDHGHRRAAARVQLVAQAFERAVVHAVVVHHGVGQVLQRQALGLVHVFGHVHHQAVAGQRLQALGAALRAGGDDEHAAALDDGRHAGGADRFLDGGGQLLFGHRRQAEGDAHVVVAHVELRHRTQRARQLVPQRPAHAAPQRLGHLRRVAPGRHAQARAPGGARLVDRDGDLRRQLASPQHQLIDQHVQHAGIGKHLRLRQALAHVDLAAHQPLAARGQHGTHHVGQVEHLAVLRRRVFAKAQHVLRGHAGLARALDRFGDRHQAAHQAGLQPVQAVKLLGRGVERHGDFLPQLAHHLGPGQGAVDTGRRVAVDVRAAGLGGIAGRAAPRALFGGEPVQCHGLPFVLSLPTCRRGLGIFLEGYRRLNSHRLT